MKENKPNDRSIVIGIQKRNREKILNWYKVDSSYNEEVWKSSEKITDTKSISYSIYHNMESPETSYLTIHLMKKDDKNTPDMYLIRIIKHPIFVLLLLRSAIHNSGSKIIDHSSIIIKNKKDNLILLTKNDNFGKWLLPGSLLTTRNNEESVKNELKKYGLQTSPYDVKTLKFRNIINIDNIYYNIIPYIVEKYKGTLNDLKRSIWINSKDFYLYPIGPESTKVLKFYNKDGLPF